MLKEVPWRYIKRAIAWIRRRYYTRPWPTDHPALLLGADAAGLEKRLRELEHAEGMQFSYRYEGEDLNLRIPWGVSDAYGPRELHIRGREIDGGLEVIAHLEPSRYECREAHIDTGHVDWEAGYEALLALVNDAVVEERAGE